MSTFALDVNSNAGDIITGLNYALANLGVGAGTAAANVLTANTATGEITTTSSNVGGYTTTSIVNYLYPYMDVKYANSSTGGSGFTSNSRLSTYYGLRNTSNVTISNNPVDYVWYQASGGFGTTKALFYTTGGGNSIGFFVGNAAPNQYYQAVPDMPTANSAPIVLASISSNLVVAKSLSNSSVTTQAIAPAAVTGYNIAANTITGNLIQANTIQANSLVAGSITATQISASYIYAGNIVSNTATLGNTSSTGYWLSYLDGDARFGGNVSIGANLNVSGLVTASNLQTNTVTTTNIVSQAVSQGNAASSTTGIIITNPGASAYYYTYANVTVNLASTSGISNYVTGVLATDQTFNYTGGGSTQTWIMTFYLSRNSTTLLAQTFRYDVNSVNQSRFNNIVPFAFLDTGLSANTNYVYSLAVAVSPSGTSTPQLILKSGSLICQILKR
jgi:hypothetical protein